MKIHDLSLRFNITDMVFPGTPEMSYKLSHTIEKDNYNLGLAMINSHAGTHTDAPRHFIDNGKALDAVNIESCCGPCTVIDLRYKMPMEDINVNDLSPFEKTIQEKRRVLLFTGWSANHNTQKYYTDYQRISLDAAKYLVSLGIVLVGVEAPSLNPPFYIEVHKAFLEKDIVVVEGLTNLGKIINKDVIFCSAPLAFEGADGFPLRAFAIEL